MDPGSWKSPQIDHFWGTRSELWWKNWKKGEISGFLHTFLGPKTRRLCPISGFLLIYF